MSRQEAVEILMNLGYDDYDKRNDEAMSMAIAALKPPTPRPRHRADEVRVRGEGENMVIRPKTGCGNCLSSRLYRVRHDNGLGAWKARERREVLEYSNGIQGAIKV